MKVFADTVLLLTSTLHHAAYARGVETREENTMIGGPNVLALTGDGGVRGSKKDLQLKQGYLSTNGGMTATDGVLAVDDPAADWELSEAPVASPPHNDGLRVHELYTFGAPSVTRSPITARGNCVPGLRLYTENVMDWSWPHPADFAAMVNQDLGHPKMNMLMLNNRQSKFWNHNGGHNSAKYLYKPCRDLEGDQHHYWWPKNQHSNMDIHGMNEAYLPRLKYFFFGTRYWEQDNTSVRDIWDRSPTNTGVPEKLIKSAVAYGTMAQLNYWEVGEEHIKWQLDNKFPPGWQLVKEGAVYSGNKGAGAEDRDHIRLFKNKTNCVFTFEGSNIETTGGVTYDLGRFTLPGAGNMVTWCGKHNLHSGVKDELWTIVHSSAYQGFKPELATCQKVTCAGHSLGGALCDMWTHLANNGVADDNDTDCWTKLAW